MENQKQLSIQQASVYMVICFLLGIGGSYFYLAKFLSNKSETNALDACPKCDYSTDSAVHYISATTAHNLADRYVSECQPALTAIINRDSITDARSIQFPLATLKKYIWEIESRVCGCDSFNNLGIRFYYAKYPDLNTDESNANPDLSTINKQYSFLHTVFLVPTYRTAAGIDQDFEPMDITNCRQSDARRAGSVLSIMNHGNLSPPPFPDAKSASATPSGLSY